MIEVELRARISSKVKNNLYSFSGLVEKSNVLHQSDLYLKHILDINRDMVIRFREVNGSSTLLTFKGKVSSEDTAWPEYETKIENAKQLESLLLSSGYEKVVLIDKTRKSFSYKGMEVNVDLIDNLGEFIEVEIIVGEESMIDVAKNKILKFFTDIGINHDDIVLKGYVPLCIEAGIK